MTFAFSEICTFLDYLEALETAQPPLLAADKRDRLRCTTEAWFKSHRNAIDKLDAPGAVALLSTLLPEKRPDRVYGLQATSLCRILSRSLGLGAAQNKSLLAYKEPGRGDLAVCLQHVLDQGGPPALPKVTLIEVDELLTWLAGQCHFSDPALQCQPPSSSEVRDRQLGDVIKRLPGRDAKWLVRLIVKDLSPVSVDDRLVLGCFHFLMPDLLRFQQDLTVAVGSLKTHFQQYSSTADHRAERLLKLHASSLLKPLINTKVSRPEFTKARSIEHCLQMLGSQSWVIERKYDGEYAEIHIDTSASENPEDCIKIFAKSGKDATRDRKGIHETLITCLRLGKPDCQIKQKAILLGELVAWSDETHTVLPFEEIRKHVTRSGVYIGTNQDDRPQNHEHLCIVFFDLLLLDDNVVMSQSIEKRRLMLKSLYDKIPGKAKSAEWKLVDFGQGALSQRRLMEQFAASNARGCEGLVFKPCGLPYYSLERDPGRGFHCYIKLKKDYIAGLGDEADFAVVGASYNAQEAAKSKLPNLRWTEFYLGTMLNKEEAIRFGQRPLMRVVGSISHHHCIPPAILEVINKTSVFSAVQNVEGQTLPNFDIEQGHLTRLETIFTTPLVLEVLGSGFVKPSNCDFMMLRHARVTKLHQDRSWKDCIGFDELQQIAVESRETGVAPESQENREHLARLEATLKKKFEKQALLSPTATKSATTSPARTERSNASSPRQPLAPVAANVQPMNNATSDDDLPRGQKRSGEAIDSRAEYQAKRVCQAATSNRPASQMSTSSNVNRKLSRTVAPSTKRLLLSRQRLACAAAGCVLAKAVVYLTPCIANTPYISQDLLTAHDVVVTTSWQDWVRDISDSDRSSPVVDESQAYPDLRRVILVEANRQSAYQAILDRILDSSSPSVGAGNIEVWDWRVLESMRSHVRATVVQHMIGVIRTDHESGRPLFEVFG